MPVPLHVAPVGLLELYRLRTLGKAPDEFGTTVIPTTDVTDFYGWPRWVASSGAPTVGAFPNLAETVTITQPMRFRGLAARLTVGAAPITAGGYLEWGVTQGPAASNVSLGQVAFGTAAATAQIGGGCELKGIILGPGWSWYAVAQGTAAGADHSLLAIALIEPYPPSP